MVSQKKKKRRRRRMTAEAIAALWASFDRHGSPESSAVRDLLEGRR